MQQVYSQPVQVAVVEIRTFALLLRTCCLQISQKGLYDEAAATSRVTTPGHMHLPSGWPSCFTMSTLHSLEAQDWICQLICIAYSFHSSEPLPSKTCPWKEEFVFIFTFDRLKVTSLSHGWWKHLPDWQDRLFAGFKQHFCKSIQSRTLCSAQTGPAGSICYRRHLRELCSCDPTTLALQAVNTKAVAAPPRPTSSSTAQKSSTSAEQTIADEAK